MGFCHIFVVLNQVKYKFNVRKKYGLKGLPVRYETDRCLMGVMRIFIWVSGKV